MYPIDSGGMRLWQTVSRQTANIGVYLNGGAEALVLTEADILWGGLTVRRSAVSGVTIAPGECIAAELRLRLNNYGGKWDAMRFSGAEFRVTVGVKDGTAAGVCTIPMGIFYADEVMRDGDAVVITALDALATLDRAANLTGYRFPMTAGALVKKLCDDAGVPFVGGIPHGENAACARPSTAGVSYRRLLAWACQLTGCCGYIDGEGYFRMGWYEQVPALDLFPGQVFSAPVSEKQVRVSGVYVRLQSGLEHLEGDETGLVLKIEENELMGEISGSGSAEEWAQSLSFLIGTSYYPFEAVTLPAPYLLPMDCVSLYDRRGNDVTLCITDTVFTLNGNTALQGKGESGMLSAR